MSLIGRAKMPNVSKTPPQSILEQNSNLLSVLAKFSNERHALYPVMIPDAKIAYIPMGKSAQTSCKSFIFEHRTGITWDEAKSFLYRYAQDIIQYCESSDPTIKRLLMRIDQNKNSEHGMHNIHNFIGSNIEAYKKIPELGPDFTSFAIIRNPVERMQSIYRFFVHVEKEFEKVDTSKTNLPIFPTFEEFLENIDRYESISTSLPGHLLPQSKAYGPDPSIFTHIIPLENINRFYQHINKRCGKLVNSYKENSSDNFAHTNQQLSKKSLGIIRERYALDFSYYESFRDSSH